MNTWLEKKLTGSRFAGLEIQLTSESRIMHLVILKRNGKEVVIEKEVVNIESYKALKGQLSKEIPLTIRITGKGILYRRIAADKDTEKNKLLAKVFPNAAPNDFLLETAAAADGELYLAILRKSVADELSAELRAENLSVVGVGIGIPAIANLLPLFGGTVPEISFGKHFIRLQDGLPAEVAYDETADVQNEIETGGQKTSSVSLPAFAAAFEQLTGKIPVHGGEEKKDFLERKLFRKGTAAFLAFSFSLLLINFLAFSFYNNKHAELEDRLDGNGNSSEELIALEKNVAEKRNFLAGSGLLYPSHHSFYADCLAAGLPPEITLIGMNLSPRVKFAEEDSIAFTPSEIIITGSCSETIILNNWIQKLNSEKWIRSVVLENYFRDKTMQRGEFRVTLHLP